MIPNNYRRPRRRAAALVEFAFVAMALVLLLWGIIEYSRFLFMLQIAENAAREGARYAVVHTGDGTTKQMIIDEVNARMASRQNELSGYTVDVLNVDPNTGATITGTTWDQASFGTAIEVKITGNYQPILPSLLRMNSTIPVRITAMMSSEAN